MKNFILCVSLALQMLQGHWKLSNCTWKFTKFERVAQNSPTLER